MSTIEEQHQLLTETLVDNLRKENELLRAELESAGKKAAQILERLDSHLKAGNNARMLAVMAVTQLEAAQRLLNAYETGDADKIRDAKAAYATELLRAQSSGIMGHGQPEANNARTAPAP